MSDGAEVELDYEIEPAGAPGIGTAASASAGGASAQPSASAQPGASWGPAGPVPASIKDVEISPGVTLAGIVPDLVIHTRRRNGRAAWRYGIDLAVTALLSSGFHMMLLWRLGAFCRKLKLLPVSLVVEKVIQHWYGCWIPCSVRMGAGIWVPHPMGIVLASKACLGKGVWLRQHAQVVHVWERGTSGVIGDYAQLHTMAVVIKGGIVGARSIVGAQALVNKGVPAGHMAVGSPARVRPLKPEQLPLETPRWR